MTLDYKDRHAALDAIASQMTRDIVYNQEELKRIILFGVGALSGLTDKQLVDKLRYYKFDYNCSNILNTIVDKQMLEN